MTVRESKRDTRYITAHEEQPESKKGEQQQIDEEQDAPGQLAAHPQELASDRQIAGHFVELDRVAEIPSTGA
jgi:hypothetical protein